MVSYTGSIAKGKKAPEHNRRKCYGRTNCPENIDLSKSSENVVLIDVPIKDAYQAIFKNALDKYNAKQVEKGHKERQIPDYLEHVRKDKKLNECYEFVIQIGNMDEHPEPDVCVKVLTDFYSSFKEQYGEHFVPIQAIIHLDESTPHMHFEIVPCAKSSRGLQVQNSLNKAIKQAGFVDFKEMRAGFDLCLLDAMKKNGLSRKLGDKERQLGGVSIDTFRKSMAYEKSVKESLKELRDQQEKLEQEITKSTERLESLRQAETDIETEIAALDDNRSRVNTSIREIIQRFDGMVVRLFEQFQRKLNKAFDLKLLQEQHFLSDIPDVRFARHHIVEIVGNFNPKSAEKHLAEMRQNIEELRARKTPTPRQSARSGYVAMPSPSRHTRGR